MVDWSLLSLLFTEIILLANHELQHSSWYVRSKAVLEILPKCIFSAGTIALPIDQGNNNLMFCKFF